MAVDSAVSFAVEADNYPSIFRTIILRNAQKNLREVRAIGGILPDEEREQVLHTLSFTIKMLGAWEITLSLLREVSPKLIQAGLCDEWAPYLKRGIERSLVEKDRHGRAELELQLGTLYQLRGKFEFAHENLASSAEIFRKLGEEHQYAVVLNRLASVERRQSKHEGAKGLVDNAISLLHMDDPEIANSYVVLGELAFDQRNWQEAEGFFTQALAIWEREGDQRKMAVGLRNVGVSYIEQGKYDKAIQCYEKAISFLQTEQDSIDCAATQMNLANVYQIIGHRLDVALKLYRNAESIFRQLNDNLHLAMLYSNLGITYRKLKKWDDAEKACTASIRGWQELGNLRQVINSMDDLGLVFFGKGEPSRAITVFEQALQQLDQIKDEPGYSRLLELLNEHILDAYAAKEVCN